MTPQQLLQYRNSLNVEPPILCEEVRYQGRLWRVESFHCPVVQGDPPEEGTVKRVIFDILAREADSLAKKGMVMMRYCSRDEATHVGLYAVCGATVRIDQIERTGRLCWSDPLVEELRKRIDEYARDHLSSHAQKLVPDNL